MVKVKSTLGLEAEFLLIDKNGKIVHTSQKKSPRNPTDSENLSFYNLLTKSIMEINHDPYSSSNARRISAFARIGDSIDLDARDLANTSTLLLQTLNAWLGYTSETGWQIIGYDGPQVPKYPWKKNHKHELEWEQ